VIETVGLALAHDPTKVLRQVDCHGQFAMLIFEVCDALRVYVGPLLRALQHQPGRPARGQWPLLQLDDAWERLARAPLAWP
jgi:hypothetical protein